jgi:hypothetical protein
LRDDALFVASSTLVLKFHFIITVTHNRFLFSLSPCETVAFLREWGCPGLVAIGHPLRYFPGLPALDLPTPEKSNFYRVVSLLVSISTNISRELVLLLPEIFNLRAFLAALRLDRPSDDSLTPSASAWALDPTRLCLDPVF